MKGSIRFFTGLLVTLGSVGGLETNPDASVTLYIVSASIGLLIMYSGVKAFGGNNANAI